VIGNYNKKSQGSSGVTLAKVDIDQLSELSSKYNVEAVPTGMHRS
jgi:thioredoxin-like negative regulator of GroEL